MPSQPLDINVNVNKGVIDSEIEKLVQFANSGIQLQVNVQGNGLSAISTQINAIRSTSLFDTAKITKDISSISAQLSQLQAKAAKINIGTGQNQPNGGLILPASYTSTLQNIGNQASAATAKVQGLGSSISKVAENLAKLSIRKDIGGTAGIIDPSNTFGTNRLLGRAQPIEDRIRASSPFQAREAILREAEIQKQVAKFTQQSFPRELLGQITGGGQGRVNARLSAAAEYAKDFNLPGLSNRLQASVRGQANSNELPRLFQPENLNFAAGGRIAQAAIFGGTPAAVGATIGAVTPFGAAGALAGSLAVQAVDRIIGPIIDAVKEKVEEYKESGQALAQSILSISAVGQATSQVVGAGGNPTRNIAASLEFQERRAGEIQQAARAKLLPLGIGGQQEGTFVRGVVSALSQRGISADANQVANISRSLAGIIQTQRPQLLDNPALLNRDLQDVLSGLPQARRTILGSLIRDTLPDLAKASTGADIEKALSSKSVFADVAANSQNVVAVQNRLAGAQEAVNTAGGEAFLNAQKSSLQFQTAVAQTPEAKEFAKNIGELSGELDGLGKHFQSVSGLLGSVVFNAFYDFAKNVGKLIPQSQEDKANAEDAAAEETVRRLQAVSSNPLAKTQIDTILSSVGLKDKIDTFNEDTERSPGAQIRGLQEVVSRFGNDPKFVDRGAGIFSQLGEAQAKNAEQQEALFGSGGRADLTKSIFASSISLPEQEETASKQAQAAQAQLEKAQKDNIEAEKNRTSVAVQLREARARLQGLQNLRKNVNLGNDSNQVTYIAPDGTTHVDQHPGDFAQSTRNPLYDSLAEAESKAKSSVRELENTKDKQDAQIPNIVDSLIKAENQTLELRRQQTEEVKKQGDAFEKIFEKVGSSFDRSTVAGGAAFAKASAPSIKKALDDALKSVDNDSDNIAANAAAKRNADSQAASATDPRIRSKFEEQSRTLALRQDQLEGERQDSQATVRIRQRQFRDNELFAASGPERELERQAEGIDAGTFLGEGALAGNANQRIGARTTANLAEIQRINSTAGRSPDQIQSDNETIERLTRENTRGGVASIDNALRQQNAPFKQDEGLANLDIATRNLGTSIQEEINRRNQLNSTLATSTAALENFGKTAEAQRAGKDTQLLDLNDQIARETGGNGPLGYLSDDRRRGIKLNSLSAQFNQLSAETGIGIRDDHGFGADNIVSLNGNGQFQSGLKEQEANLVSSVASASKELNNLADTFRAARDAIQISINTGRRQTGSSVPPGAGTSVQYTDKYGNVHGPRPGTSGNTVASSGQFNPASGAPIVPTLSRSIPDGSGGFISGVGGYLYGGNPAQSGPINPAVTAELAKREKRKRGIGEPITSGLTLGDLADRFYEDGGSALGYKPQDYAAAGIGGDNSSFFTNSANYSTYSRDGSSVYSVSDIAKNFGGKSLEDLRDDAGLGNRLRDPNDPNTYTRIEDRSNIGGDINFDGSNLLPDKDGVTSTLTLGGLGIVGGEPIVPKIGIGRTDLSSQLLAASSGSFAPNVRDIKPPSAGQVDLGTGLLGSALDTTIDAEKPAQYGGVLRDASSAGGADAVADAAKQLHEVVQSLAAAVQKIAGGGTSATLTPDAIQAAVTAGVQQGLNQ